MFKNIYVYILIFPKFPPIFLPPHFSPTTRLSLGKKINFFSLCFLLLNGNSNPPEQPGGFQLFYKVWDRLRMKSLIMQITLKMGLKSLSFETCDGTAVSGTALSEISGL